MTKGPWEVLDDDDFRPQESICLMTLDEWRQDDEALKKIWSTAVAIDIRGTVGPFGPTCNGVYDPLETFDKGYRKRNDPNVVIEYNRTRKLWQMKCHTTRGCPDLERTQGLCAFLPDEQRTPLDVLASKTGAVWYVLVNGSWEKQASMKVNSFEIQKEKDNSLYGHLLAEAVTLDVRGASGINAFKINGVYDPIDEYSGGWPVYQRRGGVDYWLEYTEDRGNWQIKSASHRGMDSAFAYVDSYPAKFPEKCGNTWWVYTGNKGAEANSGWEKQKSMSVMSSVERQAEDQKLFEKRKAHCVPVDIRGATGPRGGGLNGVFEPSDEMKGGWPVYRKRDDGEWWLEYDACPQKWMIRPTSCRGTTRGRAYILCDPHTRPENAKGVWRLSDGKGGWAPEPTVQVVAETVAVAQDKASYETRRAAAVDIDIRGATKPVVHINGVYEPTDEVWHAWPVYRKKGCDTHYLEYHAPSSSWQVKPASVRGTKRCWAYLQADNVAPEQAMKAWVVIVNGEHLKQDAVTVTTHQEQAQNDKLLGSLRRRSCGPIKIRGASGRHGPAINGVYEPSPSDLCGGWPVYYNISSRMYRTGADGEPEPPRALLVFSPYAMSWAVTVMCTPAEYAKYLEVATNGAATESKGPEADGGTLDANAAPAPATVAAPSSSSTAAAAAASTEDKDAPRPEATCSPSSVLDTAVNMSLNSGERAEQPAEGSAASTSLTLAFLEVASNAQPELARSTSTWKVLAGAQFETQAAIKLAAVSPNNSSVAQVHDQNGKNGAKAKAGTANGKIAAGGSNGAVTNGSSSHGNNGGVNGSSPPPKGAVGPSGDDTLGDASDGKSTWQSRGISLSGAPSVPVPTPATQPGSAGKGAAAAPKGTPGKESPGKASGDAATSGEETRDEWLEVKQGRRAKGAAAPVPTPSAGAAGSRAAPPAKDTAKPPPAAPAPAAAAAAVAAGAAGAADAGPSGPFRAAVLGSSNSSHGAAAAAPPPGLPSPPPAVAATAASGTAAPAPTATATSKKAAKKKKAKDAAADADAKDAEPSSANTPSRPRGPADATQPPVGLLASGGSTSSGHAGHPRADEDDEDLFAAISSAHSTAATFVAPSSLPPPLGSPLSPLSRKMVSTLAGAADTGPRLGAPMPEGVGMDGGDGGVLLGASLLGGEVAGRPEAGTDHLLGNLSFDFFSSFSLGGRPPAPVGSLGVGVGVGVGVGGLGGLSDLQGLSPLSPEFAYHGHAAAAPSLLLSELMDDSALDADGAPGGTVGGTGGSSGKSNGGSNKSNGNGVGGGGGLLGTFAGGGGGGGGGGSPPYLSFPPAGAGAAAGDALYFSPDAAAETERLRALVGSLQAELRLEREKVEDLRYHNVRLQMRVQSLEDSLKSFGFNN